MKLSFFDSYGNQIFSTDKPIKDFDRSYTETDVYSIHKCHFSFGVRYVELRSSDNKIRYMAMADFVENVYKFQNGMIAGTFEFYKRRGSNFISMRLKDD